MQYNDVQNGLLIKQELERQELAQKRVQKLLEQQTEVAKLSQIRKQELINKQAKEKELAGINREKRQVKARKPARQELVKQLRSIDDAYPSLRVNRFRWLVPGIFFFIFLAGIPTFGSIFTIVMFAFWDVLFCVALAVFFKNCTKVYTAISGWTSAPQGDNGAIIQGFIDIDNKKRFYSTGARMAYVSFCLELISLLAIFFIPYYSMMSSCINIASIHIGVFFIISSSCNYLSNMITAHTNLKKLIIWQGEFCKIQWKCLSVQKDIKDIIKKNKTHLSNSIKSNFLVGALGVIASLMYIGVLSSNMIVVIVSLLCFMLCVNVYINDLYAKKSDDVIKLIEPPRPA